MMESVAYEMIKKEGYDEGVLAEGREMVLEALAERFGPVPRDIEEVVTTMESRRQIKELLRLALRVQNLDEFRKLLTSPQWAHSK